MLCYIFISVLVPPSFNLSSTGNVTVVENTTATLSCQFRGYPRPAIDWTPPTVVSFTSMSEISAPTITYPHQYISDVTIGRVRKSMEGFYACVGTNGLGSDVRRFYLKVFGKLSCTFIRINIVSRCTPLGRPSLFW